ncbi:precorrin-6y C5,15-methyltransferase (decarboxylating) subunit CbiE [Magnetospira sp. QH-2]|uniref:precorrin-6y C5,15-methyltransferase (decarboxylating) subunit CbiE n=1 Tax=Magnetospira sp. (strain QH-2) TaxID=1288970 RepID=UPI0003E80F58|nr:precorrin-6y C5,15-methyltransferase (decarboxylating) subunit CbiE [Magnetospira sp. QH-2]CCQ72062.1 Precorrin-6Y C(5,15)-methyltransferase [Magnetospira sp. QH-2]
MHVLGLGDDGPDSLSPAARSLIEGADLLVGGARHLAMIERAGKETLSWADGFQETLDRVLTARGRCVVVLASGDPQWYGVGATLARHVPAEEMRVLPVPGAFSLAAARLCWPLADVVTTTIHGRPIEAIRRHLAPGARLLILSQDGASPAALATLLTGDGWGPSDMTVLEHLVGAAERIVEAKAEQWSESVCADLNVIAVTCRPGPTARPLPLTPGLPDDCFEHDGQLTKREVRAVTVSALAPQPGDCLWDLGAGSGSVAIECLRAQPALRAVAVERSAERAARMARNALALGVPELQIMHGEVPDILGRIEQRPDVIFVGGGVGRERLLQQAWAQLASGGRMVANGVTLEAERRLLDFQACHGGDLVRLEISHPKAVGAQMIWESKAPVIQLRAIKA